MSKCKLLSLDTSSTDSGWAYFENGILEDYGHIEMNKKDDSIIKQEKMIIALKELVDRIDPDICVIETPPYMNSPKTLILLAEIVGSVRGMVIDRCQYEEMEPKRWRRLVAMDGEKIPNKSKESKAWDIAKVKEYYDIDTTNDNVADGILIGLAYCRFMESLAEKKNA